MKTIIKLMLILLSVFFIDITVYAYTAYKVGDIVSYNGMEFYVIKDSSTDEDSVTMLKAEPLSVAEVNTYGAGHVNMNVPSSKVDYHTAHNSNGYGGMQYYSSLNCGYNGTVWVYNDCTNVYKSSEIKYVVDMWALDKFDSGLQEARLITLNELINNFGYEYYEESSVIGYKKAESTYSWVYNNDYFYWTMSEYDNSQLSVWYVNKDGNLDFNRGAYSSGVVRPVISLNKTALGDKDESVINDKDDKKQSENKSSDDKKETTTKVKVENTYMSQTLIIMIIGFISVCSGVVIYYLIRNKKIKRKKL